MNSSTNPVRRSGRALASILGAVFGASLCATAALAEQVTFTATVPAPPEPLPFAPWTASFALPQFDPSLGSLQSVQVSLDGTVIANTAIENRDPVPRTITSTAGSTVVLGANFSAILWVTPGIVDVNNLEPYDGENDYAGLSGDTNPQQTVTAASSVTYQFGVDDLTVWQGVGEVPFSLEGTAEDDAFGATEYTLGSNVQSGATVTVTYTYDPSGGEGATIGDRVWLDEDGDGVDDGGLLEPGMRDAVVELRNLLGELVDVTVTNGDGAYTFTGVDAGNYEVIVYPPTTDNWVATADPDGIATPGRAVVAVAEGETLDDVDFGFVPVALPLLSEEQPAFWSKPDGLELVFAPHLELLTSLPLVDRNGQPVDFGADVESARAALASFLQRASNFNVANRLSAQLAAFALNVSQGIYPPETLFDLGNGVRLSATGVLDQATAILALDSFTPGGDPNRAVQNSWVCRLRQFNGGAPCN